MPLASRFRTEGSPARLGRRRSISRPPRARLTDERRFAFHGRTLQVGFHLGLIVYFGLYFLHLDKEHEALAALGVGGESGSRATSKSEVKLRLTDGGLRWREVSDEDACGSRWSPALTFDADVLLESIQFGAPRDDI